MIVNILAITFLLNLSFEPVSALWGCRKVASCSVRCILPHAHIMKVVVLNIRLEGSYCVSAAGVKVVPVHDN